MSTISGLNEIIEGKVMVTRNPCTHPGDFRLLECVDHPDLRYLHNVVVFSSKGERPQCNMMSGGDLDGDTYFVAWDKELLSYIKPESIYPPADYSKNELIKEKPDSEELEDYFAFYIERDVLGVVSNLWLKLSDLYGQFGPTHEHCTSLSYMCSVAVDFAKHGECVSKKNFEDLQKLVRDHKPDFMEKDDMKAVQSDGVLGILYRDIKCDNAQSNFISNDWKKTIRLEYNLDPKILSLGQKPMMHKYLLDVYTKIVLPMTTTFRKIMMYFLLATEGELFSCDLKFRMCQMTEDKNFYQGDPGCKVEDAI